MLGVDSETPYFCINGTVYKGKYMDTLGTDLIFESIAPDASSAPAEQEEGAAAPPAAALPKVRYLTHATKRLELNRVFAKKKKSKADEEAAKGAGAKGAKGAGAKGAKGAGAKKGTKTGDSGGGGGKRKQAPAGEGGGTSKKKKKK